VGEAEARPLFAASHDGGPAAGHAGLLPRFLLTFPINPIFSRHLQVYIPKEIVHNLTIAWLGGDLLCRLCKFFGAFLLPTRIRNQSITFKNLFRCIWRCVVGRHFGLPVAGPLLLHSISPLRDQREAQCSAHGNHRLAHLRLLQFASGHSFSATTVLIALFIFHRFTSSGRLPIPAFPNSR
jgi:hypothetical protein